MQNDKEGRTHWNGHSCRFISDLDLKICQIGDIAAEKQI